MNNIIFLVIFVSSCFSAVVAGEADTNNLQIICGRNTTVYKHPYQVSIHVGLVTECSGVVLDHKWVLTTGSCIARAINSPNTVVIRAKSSNCRKGGEVYACEAVFVNKRFNVHVLDYNVGLLKIIGTFKYGRTLMPIKIANEPLTVGQQGVLSGWESIRMSLNSEILKETTVEAINSDSCAKAYPNYNMTARMLCADSRDYGVCWNGNADALVAGSNLYGLLSFNSKHGDLPSVYTNIPNLRKWIYYTMRKNRN